MPDVCMLHIDIIQIPSKLISQRSTNNDRDERWLMSPGFFQPVLLVNVLYRPNERTQGTKGFRTTSLGIGPFRDFLPAQQNRF